MGFQDGDRSGACGQPPTRRLRRRACGDEDLDVHLCRLWEDSRECGLKAGQIVADYGRGDRPRGEIERGRAEALHSRSGHAASAATLAALAHVIELAARPAVSDEQEYARRNRDHSGH